MSKQKRFAPKASESDDGSEANEASKKETLTKSEKTKKSESSLRSETLKTLQLVEYTERSIVVIGSGTLEHSDSLQKLGGKFNPKLKCGSGWVFAKTRKEYVEKFIKSGVVEIPPPKKWDKSEGSKQDLTQIFKELKEAFDSDEEYTGDIIHEVLTQIKEKYEK